MLINCYNQQNPGYMGVFVDAPEYKKMVSINSPVNIDIFHKAPWD